MSARVYEVANVLHKGTEQVFSELQKLGAPVKRWGDMVSDQDILRLAETYGRKKYVLPLVSNEFIEELAKTWSEEALMTLLSDVDWSRSHLSERDAGRVLNVKKCVPGCVEEVSNVEAIHKNPKAFRALYLVGAEGKAIAMPKDKRNIQVFLVPNGKKDEVPCCIAFDSANVFHTKLNVKSCMVLIWADGRYIYEPASFTKMQDKYYFELPKEFSKCGIEEVQYEQVGLNGKKVWDMVQWILPGKSGFAMQEKQKCIVKFDKSQLRICNGEIDTLSWKWEDTKRTMKNSLDVRIVMDALLAKTGEMDCEAFQMEEKHLLDAMKVMQIYTDEDWDEISEAKMALAVEGYLRLRILEKQGLSKQVVNAFAKARKVHINKNRVGNTPFEDHFIEMQIKKFEEKHKGMAYYCVLTRGKQGTVANIFYVADARETWESEREDLENGTAKVYKEYLSNKKYSKTSLFQFKVVNGQIS